LATTRFNLEDPSPVKDSDHNAPKRSAAGRSPDAELTVIGARHTRRRAGDAAHPLKVAWLVDGERHTARFSQGFDIGRSAYCGIRFDDDGVSRTHAKLFVKAGTWHVADLDSGNGSLLDGLRITEAVLPQQSTLQLGLDGPKLWLEAEDAEAGASPDEIAEYYLGERADDQVGPKTLMFRRVYRHVEKKQMRRYRGIVAGAVGLLILSVGIGIYQHLALQKTRELAIDIFYSMKTVQVQVAHVDTRVRESGDPAQIAEIDARREEVHAMEAEYDRFLDELGIMGPNLSAEDRIILRVARMFGECELNIPDGFVREVKNYIAKWQTTDRLETGLRRMHEQNLTATISATMLENHLPPQFLYLALQESEFNARAIGPKTRFGIAKGIWQFIPSTARRYGLRTGPLVELRRHDPRDQRFDAVRATEAAARYLRDIYSKESQASGLLAIASYNWGPNNIRKRIREMPDNPRDRNFWQLLNQHEIPQETYDYVFYIVAAIVIGEDPGLFGFDFENPLKDIDESATDV